MTRRTYQLTPPPGVSAPSSPSSAPIPEGITTEPGASNKQLAYLASLCQSREFDHDARVRLTARIAVQLELNEEHGDCEPPLGVAGLTKTRAHDFIARLRAKPQRSCSHTGPATNLPGLFDLPAGHYAIKNADGQLRFYNVWRGNRNANYIRLHVEHGPNDSEIPFGTPEFKAILKTIAEDAHAAARLYGRHIGACSNCNRRLTNRVSRLLDIGPVCGGHTCDEAIWTDMKARARQALRDAGLDPDADVEDTDDLDAIREAAGL